MIQSVRYEGMRTFDGEVSIKNGGCVVLLVFIGLDLCVSGFEKRSNLEQKIIFELCTAQKCNSIKAPKSALK